MIIVISVIVLALGFWFFYPLRSYLVMSIYSAQHEKDSVMRSAGFDIDIPSGAGWYPFVMTYHADGFARWSGIDADMSIMYNFGAFDARTRTSAIYDPQSEWYSAFYGAYAVRQEDGVFGFAEDGRADMDAVSLAFQYDYTQLVMAAFGCREPAFAVDEWTETGDVTYAGISDWTRIDAWLSVNGTAHNYRGYKQPYLQYGRPMVRVDDDFAPVSLYGRVYMKYFEEYDSTVMLYVIAPSKAAVNACDMQILKRTHIHGLNF
jgi:hypothetical protein